MENAYELDFELEDLAGRPADGETPAESSPLSEDESPVGEEAQALELVDWLYCSVMGVSEAVVVSDEACLAASHGTSEKTQGVASLLVMHLTRLTSKLGAQPPIAFEVSRGDQKRLLGLKLSAGYLCSVAEPHIELSTLAGEIKRRGV